jgi:hypothetical protein
MWRTEAGLAPIANLGKETLMHRKLHNRMLTYVATAATVGSTRRSDPRELADADLLVAAMMSVLLGTRVARGN